MRLVWALIPLILIVFMIGIIGVQESYATSCSLYTPRAFFTSEKVTIIEVIDEKPINKKVKTGFSWQGQEFMTLLTEQYTLQPLKSFKGNRTQEFVYDGGGSDSFPKFNKGDIALIFEYKKSNGELNFGLCSTVKLKNGEDIYEYNQKRHLIPLEYYLENRDSVIEKFPWFLQTIELFEEGKIRGDINVSIEYLLDETDFYFLSQYFVPIFDFSKTIVDVHLMDPNRYEYNSVYSKDDTIKVTRDDKFPPYVYNITRHAKMYEVKNFLKYDSVTDIVVKSLSAFSIKQPDNSKMTIENPKKFLYSFSNMNNASAIWKLNLIAQERQEELEYLDEKQITDIYIQRLGISGTQYVNSLQNYCTNSSVTEMLCNIENISSKTITQLDKPVVLHKIKSNHYINNTRSDQITILIGLLNDKETWMIKGEYPIISKQDSDLKLSHDEFAKIVDSMKIRNYEYNWYSDFDN